MIGLLSNPIIQNSVIRAFSNFYSNKKIYQISNIQKSARNGQIVIEILKIQFWTRFFLDHPVIMNMYNLIEYSDNYEDSTASLYRFKRQEPLANNANLTNVSTSLDYRSKLLGDGVAENNNAVWKNAKIIVPLKYVSSFFRSLELPLINTKLYIELNYTKNSVISNVAGNSTFRITKTELYVPVVTLKTEDNNK